MRSGYSDELDHNELMLYRANVDRSIAGKRGQAFLKELADALDAMPVKELIADELIDAEGRVCAIGSVFNARGVDMSPIDYYNPDAVAKAAGIAGCLAAEIEYINDDDDQRYYRTETPAARFARVRAWVAENLKIGAFDNYGR